MPMTTTLTRTVASTALLFAVAVPAPAGASTASTAAATAEAVDAVVRDHMEATGAPGVAVAVTHGTETVRARGYGRTATGEPVTAHTPMAIASASKAFTALAVVQLVEDGEIGLDDPVRAHLPEFDPDDPRADAVTVRQLLDNTSGMSGAGFDEFGRGRVPDLRTAVAGMDGVRFAADPGTRYSYHNPNFQVAARLVEVVSGRSFADRLHERVLDPLGMTDSTTVATDLDLPSSARGHLMFLRRGLPATEVPSFGAGSGGVLSTADDMASWLIAQNNGGASADGTRIATPEGVALTHTPSPATGGTYGLGWSVGTTPSGAPRIEHGGELFTATAHQVLLPESGHGIAVMVNTAGMDAHAAVLTEALVALIEEGGPEPASGTRAPVVDSATLALAGVAVWLGARGVRRSGTWAARRAGASGWRTASRLVPLAVPVVLFAVLDHALGVLYRSQDLTWGILWRLFPGPVALLGLVALVCVAVAAARLVRLRRGRSDSSTPVR